MRIALAFDASQLCHWAALLTPQSAGHDLLNCASAVALADAAPDIVVGNQLPFLLDFLAAPPLDLQWVHLMSAGVDRTLGVLRSAGRPIRLSNVRGIHVEAMREYVLAMLLHFHKRLPLWLDRHRAQQWEPESLPLLSGTTIVIIGTGSIGTAVAQLARSFDMHVVGVARHAGARPVFDTVLGRGDLHAALGQADFVVLALPLTDETEGLLDAACFDALRPGAVLVNVARGEIIDTPAMLSALASGRLAGAALDAFAEEPLPAASPLWHAPNVLVTPHVAGRFSDGHRRGAELFGANLAAFVQDASLLTEVELDRGY